MYRIDTGQARTDLYKSDPFDYTIAQRNIESQVASANAEKIQKQKNEAAREADIMSNLSKMGQIKIMPKDQPMFAEKANNIYDYVSKNHEKLNSGDTDAMMEYQKMLGDYQTSAEMSKNFREAWEQRGLQLQKEPGAYRPDVIEQHLNRASTEDAGNWNIDDSIYKKNINYNDRVMSVLQPSAQRMAKESPFKKTFTIEQANKQIEDDLTDAQLYDQAHYDFEMAKDKLGATNPVDFYKKVYAPKLVVDDTKTAPEFMYGGGTDKTRPKVAGTYLKGPGGKDTFQFEYTNTTDNPYITIPDPKDKNKTLEVKPYKVEFGGETPVLKVLTRPTGEGDSRKEGAEITLGYNSVSDIMNNKFGIENVYDLKSEESTPKHVTVKRTDVSNEERPKMTQEEFNKKWASLKPGQSAVGLDGKTYIKK